MQTAEALSVNLVRPGYPVVSQCGTRGGKAARALDEFVAALGYARPFVLESVRANELITQVARRAAGVALPEAPTQEGAQVIALAARASGCDCILAAGGGRVIDFGKVVAKFAGLPLVAIPTQLSHDGLASPIAILTDDGGSKTSMAVDPPAGIFLPLSALTSAPVRSFSAGLGDLLSNEYALLDWALAEEHGRDEVLPEAHALSEESLGLALDLLDLDPRVAVRDPVAIALLAAALVNSGMAMLLAGTTRPASGAEHKISHAIDAVTGGRAMHGAQVAFGCVLAAHLHGVDVTPLLGYLSKLGLPKSPSDLGLSSEEMRDVIVHAQHLRPERYTVLDSALADGAEIEDLLAAWPT